MVIENKSLLPRSYVFDFADINIGIVLIGLFFLFDFGSFQGVFEIVNKLRLPFILAFVTVVYAIYLAAIHFNEIKSKTTNRFALTCLFIIVYSQYSTINPTFKESIITELLQYFANYIIIVTTIKKPTQFVLLIDIFLAAIMHSSFHAIMQGGKLYDSIWLRDENHISLLVAMALPFALILLKESKSNLKKCFYALCLIFYVTASLIASSRGGTLAMAAGVYLTYKVFTKRKTRIFILSALTLISVIIFAPQKFIGEMKTLQEGTSEETASARIYLWRIAFEMFRDHPVFGVGPMNYSESFIEYDRGRLNPEHPDFKYVVHSTPIQWLAEMGIVGFIILISLVKTMYRNWKDIHLIKIPEKTEPKNDRLVFLKKLADASAITHVVFWVGAAFLSLMGYPFFWCLIPLSEISKKICKNYSIQEGSLT